VGGANGWGGMSLDERRGQSASPRALLYLSAFFEEHREEYYRTLLRVSQEGAWENWIEFFLRGVREQSRDALRTARLLIDLQAHYRALLHGRSLSKVTLAVLEQLFAQPVVTASLIRDRSKVNFRTAQKAIQDLEQVGVLREITGQRRSRVWVAPEIMEILTRRRPLEGA
jgi:Fic family protein